MFQEVIVMERRLRLRAKQEGVTPKVITDRYHQEFEIVLQD